MTEYDPANLPHYLAEIHARLDRLEEAKAATDSPQEDAVRWRCNVCGSGPTDPGCPKCTGYNPEMVASPPHRAPLFKERQTFDAKEIGFTLDQEPPEPTAPPNIPKAYFGTPALSDGMSVDEIVQELTDEVPGTVKEAVRKLRAQQEEITRLTRTNIELADTVNIARGTPGTLTEINGLYKENDALGDQLDQANATIARLESYLKEAERTIDAMFNLAPVNRADVISPEVDPQGQLTRIRELGYRHQVNRKSRAALHTGSGDG